MKHVKQTFAGSMGWDPPEGISDDAYNEAFDIFETACKHVIYYLSYHPSEGEPEPLSLKELLEKVFPRVTFITDDADDSGMQSNEPSEDDDVVQLIDKFIGTIDETTTEKTGTEFVDNYLWEEATKLEESNNSYDYDPLGGDNWGD